MSKKKTFTTNIEDMMFGFGDEWPPDPATVALVESIATDYIRSLTLKAQEVANLTGKLDKECFLYLVRKETAKFTRVNQLLSTHEELKQAQNLQLGDEQVS
jgi:hypothetical protein